jgi:predicted phage baseplate assembly protein
VLRLTLNGPDLVVTGRAPPAAAALPIDPRSSVPAVSLIEQPADLPWTARLDLLGSDGFSRDFVIETETTGTAMLRFGDGQHGQRPADGSLFLATYRVGNGLAGNVGAAAIAHVVSADSGLPGATNPMPADGGVEPETALAIRRDAPQAFEVQERAVTEADYATVSARNPAVAQAAATFRWTGSWYTAFVTADRADRAAVDARFETDLAGYLEYYRMAGIDLEVNGPVLVPLKIDLFVCVDPSYLRGDVLQSLLARLGSRVGPDGVLGLFHPSRLAFGQPVYLSAVYATAQHVPGVQSVTVDTFARLFDDTGTGLRDGVLPMSRLELAQCANDPDFPDHGVLTIATGGGR